MRKHGFTWLELVVVLAALLVLAAFLFPIFARSRDHKRTICTPELKQIALGIKQYLQDYDEKFSIVAVNNVSKSQTPYPQPFGWADAIQSYTKSTQIYQCPLEVNPANTIDDATQPQFTDFWFNSQLSGLHEAKLIYIANTVLLGDGNTGSDATNARYSIPKIPAAWIGDPKSPTSQHLDGMNFAFADGHVKWLKAPQMPMGATVTANRFSFEWK